MRLVFVRILLIIMVFLVSNTAEAKDAENSTPPWMEDVLTGDHKIYLIPKGAKKEVFGSQVIVEATEEYVARRIYELEQLMDDRIKEANKKYEDLSNDIMDLEQIIKRLEEKIAQTTVDAVPENSTEEGEGKLEK